MIRFFLFLSTVLLRAGASDLPKEPLAPQDNFLERSLGKGPEEKAFQGKLKKAWKKALAWLFSNESRKIEEDVKPQLRFVEQPSVGGPSPEELRRLEEERIKRNPDSRYSHSDVVGHAAKADWAVQKMFGKNE